MNEFEEIASEYERCGLSRQEALVQMALVFDTSATSIASRTEQTARELRNDHAEDTVFLQMVYSYFRKIRDGYDKALAAIDGRLDH